VPDCCGHSTYLAILAFGKRETNPGIRNRLANADRDWPRRERRFSSEELRCGRTRAAVLEIDSRGEMVKGVVGRDPLHVQEIGARVTDRGIGEVAPEGLVAREQQEAFAVSIESARRIDVGHIDVVGERLASVTVGERRQTVVGLPEPQDQVGIVEPCHRLWS
jgi:hypothetical protein